MIGFQHLDNTVTTVQCNDTGLLESTGTILNNRYNSLNLAKNLIENGDRVEDLDPVFGVMGANIWYKKWPTLEKFAQQHTSIYKYFYVYSEADNKWYVSSNENRVFRPLASEL